MDVCLLSVSGAFIVVNVVALNIVNSYAKSLYYCGTDGRHGYSIVFMCATLLICVGSFNWPMEYVTKYKAVSNPWGRCSN